MRAGVVAIALLLGSVAAAGAADQKYAGLSQAEATDLANDVVETLKPSVFALDNRDFEPGEGRPLLVGTYSSRNSRGEDAWLTIFRLPGDGSKSDQSCVWSWRDEEAPDSYGFEGTRSVATGLSSDPVHERCVREVIDRGIADPEQETGVEPTALPAVARPQPVTPFGARPAGLYVVDFIGTADGFSESGVALELPLNGRPRTCGFAGFVIDELTGGGVTGATVTITPSTTASGLSGHSDQAEAAVAVLDAFGAFTFVDFPPAPLGYNLTIRAPNYAPFRAIHQECVSDDLLIGDWAVARRPRFEDGSSYPVGR